MRTRRRRLIARKNGLAASVDNPTISETPITEEKLSEVLETICAKPAPPTKQAKKNAKK